MLVLQASYAGARACTPCPCSTLNAPDNTRSRQSALPDGTDEILTVESKAGNERGGGRGAGAWLATST